MAKAGRKPKYEEWLTDEGLTIIKGWKRRGCTNEEIAKNMGISIKSLCEWQNQFLQIREALKIEQDRANMIVENALYRLAIGGIKTTETVEDITIEGGIEKVKHIKRVTKELPPNMGALAFYLKNRAGWRDTPADNNHDNNIRVVLDWGELEEIKKEG